MKYRRHLIILISAVVLYIIFGAVYNNFVVKTNEQKVYVLNNDYKKGSLVNKENLTQLSIKVKEKNENYDLDMINIQNLVTKYNLSKGQILTKDMFIEKDKYVIANKDKEIVAIKLKSSEDSASFNISKDSIVNIYYTGKTEFANEILKNINEANIISGGSTGYISTKLLKSEKILGLYDKYGNEIISNKLNKDNEIAIDTALIEVDSNTAMTIANLKEYGDFSLSLIE